ncbi:MAG TPA: O-antigen ligase family protein [Pyrinomonadaceae bacterium]|nr:O-antigen ligase family protein [Pyrinomonadaceae bacterium]
MSDSKFQQLPDDPSQTTDQRPWAIVARRAAIVGFALYSAFAPHSIAAAEISLAIVGAGWLLHTVVTRKTGFRRTKLDLPIWLFFFWTVASSFLSVEPRISIAKIQSTCVIFLFYLTHAMVTRRIVVFLVSVMILSGCAGTIYSVYDLLRGRGVLVESVSSDSPFQTLNIRAGDAVWRIGGRRIHSVADIDEAIRNWTPPAPATVSIISQGEHIERPGLVISDAIKQRISPSGLVGTRATHRFRASGWTRHYETYSEILQILALLALGLLVANFKNHRLNLRAKLAALAFALLALGITFTAMRTVLIALAVGIVVITVRALGSRGKVISLVGICLVLTVGAFVVSQTRAQHALLLGDPSSSLRVQVAKIGLSRILLHPLFGHGMDSVHEHWNEWGFPGKDILHLHSTPLQLAFERGLPALVFWFWIIWVFWRTTSNGEKSFRDSSDTNRYGLLLGATGALAAFFASSLVNYNFGDGEVALVFWWLMGIVLVVSGNAAAKSRTAR